MKFGYFYKLPKKIIKSFERNKINLASIKLYLLLQEYVHENHTCIIDPDYFGLINK